MKKEHRKYICNVCLDHSKLFIDEIEIFESVNQLKKHHKTHPQCTFCNSSSKSNGLLLYDNEIFLKHMRDEHYSCPWCEGPKVIFYKEQSAMAAHYRQKHYLCEIGACKGQLVAFENVLDFQSHRRNAHREQLSKDELRVGFHIQNLHLHHRNQRADELDPGIQVYNLPNANERQTDFEIQNRQREYWRTQAEIERVQYGREISQVLGDRRVRPIPDAVREEEIPFKKHQLDDFLKKTLKESAKQEYHYKILEALDSGEIDCRCFFKSFRMLWNPGNELSVWVEALMLVIALDPIAQRRRDLYESYKSWMLNREVDADVRIWTFPEFHGLEMADYTLLTFQLRRIAEVNTYPDLTPGRVPARKPNRNWKRDPTQRGQRGPKKQRSGYAARVQRSQQPGRGRGVQRGRRGNPPSRTFATPGVKRPVRANEFPDLPSPPKQKPIRSPPQQRKPNFATPKRTKSQKGWGNQVQQPQDMNQQRPRKLKRPKPAAKKTESETPVERNRIVHESVGDRPGLESLQDLRDKITDIELTGSKGKWDLILESVCRTLLRILRSRVDENVMLCLNVESMTMGKSLEKVLKKDGGLENCLRDEVLQPFFGFELATQMECIRLLLQESPYDSDEVTEQLSDMPLNLLYTYTYYLYQARNAWIAVCESQSAKSSTKAAVKSKVKKKKKKKKAVKMSLQAFRR